MKPANLKTKIFLDGGDPQETKEMISLLGFLDGQTTNPTLVSKNPKVQGRLERGKKFSAEEILEFYKKIVREISGSVPEGSISVEVYADKNTGTEDMLKQAETMSSWISNAHIKFPITAEGLAAAQQFVRAAERVNMTLCFSQDQAAAVYAATLGARRGQVFVSPFVGRLDDRKENGMQLIENIIRMYRNGDGHVQVLTASVRNLNHFLYAIKLGSDIITAPAKILREWAENKFMIPDKNFEYPSAGLKTIPYGEINPKKSWQEYDISHELTEIGIEKFSEDWHKLIKK